MLSHPQLFDPDFIVRERRMVHMTSDIFGGMDKSVYSTEAQKDGLNDKK